MSYIITIFVGQTLKKTIMYKGVTEQNGKFKAQICHKGKILGIGYYDTALEAAREYDKESRRLNGQLTTKVNFTIVPQIDLRVQTEQTGKYKGVTFCETEKLFKAEIKAFGFNILVGYYDTEELAAYNHDVAIYANVGSNIIRDMSEEDKLKILNFTHDEYCKIAMREIFK